MSEGMNMDTVDQARVKGVQQKRNSIGCVYRDLHERRAERVSHLLEEKGRAEAECTLALAAFTIVVIAMVMLVGSPISTTFYQVADGLLSLVP
jgi:Flp pilus assembly pilin Flp